MKLRPALEWSEPWSTPTVILSDLHINGGSRDQIIIERLLWLTDVERDHSQDGDHEGIKEGRLPLIKRLVLLGDVFDFQLGFSQIIYRAHYPLFVCLQEVKRRGVEVIMFTGNHDPDPHPMVMNELEIAVVTAPMVFQVYGERVRLEHGDLLEPAWLKRSLCHLVRSPWVRSLARLLPPHFMWNITQRWGAQESQVGHYESMPLHTLIDKLWPQVREQSIERWLFGHFHQALCWSSAERGERERSANEGVDRGPQVIVTGDQVRLNTLVLWSLSGPQLFQFIDHRENEESALISVDILM